MKMKILHTSDWHLGRSLYGRKRYDEFSEFLDWLGDTIEKQGIDALLVAGDVFDTTTPSNRAQELYYRFLCRVSASCCRHIVVIAGNHDSPSFLNAPKALLRVLNVHVVGAVTENPEDEVVVLHDEQDLPRAIVCAVPYLRDKDIRTVGPGETIDDKNAKLIAGLKAHYAQVCAIAEHKRSQFEKAGCTGIPVVAMGHLFTAGGRTVDGDGVRELYVGSLEDIHAKIAQLKQAGSRAWLEIEYTGRDIVGSLRQMLDEALADSAMEVRRIKNKQVIDRVINRSQKNETLDDLDAGDVFARCLDAFDVPDDQREKLTASYNEILKLLQEEDKNAE